MVASAAEETNETERTGDATGSSCVPAKEAMDVGDEVHDSGEAVAMEDEEEEEDHKEEVLEKDKKSQPPKSNHGKGQDGLTVSLKS